MTDLDSQLRAVRTITAPDLWSGIEERSLQRLEEGAWDPRTDPGRDGSALPSQIRPAGNRWIAVGVAAAIALASTLLVMRELRFGAGPAPAAHPSPTVVASIPLPSMAYSMGYGDGSVWALTESGVVRIDPVTNQIVARIPIFGNHYTPNELRATPFGIFVSVERRGLVRIDPATNTVVARWPFQADFVDATSSAVWVSSPELGQVIEIDPRTDRVEARVDVPDRPTGLLAKDWAVWVVNDDPADNQESMTRIDPATATVMQVVPVHGELAEEVEWTSDDLIWVAACVRHSGLSCTWSSLGIDAHDGRVVVRRDLPIADPPLDAPFDMHAADGERLWGAVADYYIGMRPTSGTVFELDQRGRILWTVDVGSLVTDLTYGDGSLWAANGEGDRIDRIDLGG